MADRYFVDQPIRAAAAQLAGAEAHHLIHVMRAKPGTQVVLFDASGAEFDARVERVGRSEVELAVLARREVDRELAVALTLGVALPKADRQRWLIEKAVELGVSRLVPLETARSVAQPGGEPPAKLQRAVIEASKQCGRNRLMEIAAGQPLDVYLQSLAGAAVRWLAHPGGRPVRDALDRLAAMNGSHEIAVAVGPEGGFTDNEVAQAKAADWDVIDLGPRVLRIETAALALVSSLVGSGRWEVGGGKSEVGKGKG